MTYRIRRIEQTATGREIVRDQVLDGDRVTIGRLAENDLHLPDLAVEPRHAELVRDVSGTLRVAALGTLGFVLDGAETRAGGIDPAVGAELGFGAYRITVARDGDGAVLLTVRKGHLNGRRGGAGDDRRGFSLGGVLPGKRVMSWVLVAAILLGFLALPVISHLTRDRSAKADAVIGDGSWDPGALSLAHHSLQDRCEACHVEPFQSVRDETCRSCHRKIADHADPRRLAAAHGTLPAGQAALWAVAHAFGKEGPGACRDCHVEHQGKTRMAPPAQQFCADCHGGLKANLADTRLGDAADFGRRHPAFTATVVTDAARGTKRRLPLDAKLREDNGIVFTHRLHLNPQGGVARMARNIGGERGYGANGLQCADCHRPTEDGVRFQPIRMERDCEGCHSLAYDRVGGIVRRLRHGDVEQLAADIAAARWQGVGSRGSSLLLDQRHRPGVAAATGPAAGPAAGRAPWSMLSLGGALSRQGVCGECHRPITHVVGGQTRPGVVPVRIPARYMEHGWFSHRAHRQEKCSSCHAAATSDKASDVLLPGIGQCRTCHLGEDAPRSKVASSCVMCHGYHTTALGTLPAKPEDGVKHGD